MFISEQYALSIALKIENSLRLITLPVISTHALISLGGIGSHAPFLTRLIEPDRSKYHSQSVKANCDVMFNEGAVSPKRSLRSRRVSPFSSGIS